MILIFAVLVVGKHIKKIRQIPLLTPISIFLIIALVSCFFSVNLITSLTEWMRLFSLFGLYLLAYLLIKTQKDLMKLTKIIVLSIFIPVLLALYQFLTKTGVTIPLDDIYNRIFGTFEHPRLLAFYLIIPLFLAIFITLKKNRRGVINYFFLILVLLYTTTLLMTYTRGAWLAFLIVLIIIGAIKYHKFALTAIVLLLIIYLTIQPINIRVNSFFNPDSYGSIQWRYHLWQETALYTVRKPILGYGTGTAPEVIHNLRGFDLGSIHPHNDYLKILLENGLLGLLAYLGLIIFVFIRLFKKLPQEKEPDTKTLILVAIGLSFGLYIISFGDNILRNTALQWIYWALLGGLLTNKKED